MGRCCDEDDETSRIKQDCADRAWSSVLARSSKCNKCGIIYMDDEKYWEGIKRKPGFCQSCSKKKD